MYILRHYTFCFKYLLLTGDYLPVDFYLPLSPILLSVCLSVSLSYPSVCLSPILLSVSPILLSVSLSYPSVCLSYLPVLLSVSLSYPSVYLSYLPVLLSISACLSASLRLLLQHTKINEIPEYSFIFHLQ